MGISDKSPRYIRLRIVYLIIQLVVGTILSGCIGGIITSIFEYGQNSESIPFFVVLGIVSSFRQAIVSTLIINVTFSGLEGRKLKYLVYPIGMVCGYLSGFIILGDETTILITGTVTGTVMTHILWLIYRRQMNQLDIRFPE